MKRIIYLLILAAILVSCDKFNQDKKKGPVITESEEIDAKKYLAQDLTIARLEERLECLTDENERLERELAKCLGEEVKPVAKKKTAAKKTTYTPAPKKTAEVKKEPVKKSATATKTVKTEPVKRDATAGKANLEYLRQGGEIIFCVRANEREDCYFPHYAMMQNVSFNQPVVDNQVKGYNWKVEPTDFYEGDYGVTVDGTFYVSDELIEKSLQAGGLQFNNVVEIKAPYTNWELREMYHADGFWLFDTQ